MTAVFGDHGSGSRFTQMTSAPEHTLPWPNPQNQNQSTSWVSGSVLSLYLISFSSIYSMGGVLILQRRKLREKD